SFDVGGEDLIAMREELSSRIQRELLPLLHAAPEQRALNRPANDQAYALFLRATATSYDPQPNKGALAALERAVAIDPSYAPAWDALGRRAYDDAQYSDGGDAARHRAEEAQNRALLIDPDLIEAAKMLVVLRGESGDLNNGYLQAKALGKR